MYKMGRYLPDTDIDVRNGEGYEREQTKQNETT